jgi:putative Holliday junction resolvase
MNGGGGGAALAQTPSVPPHLALFLGFDFGVKRTGIATGNRVTRSATPQRSIHAPGDARWPLVAARIAQWRPDALVVGVPFHPDGAAHDNTRRARRFAQQLRGRFGLPVFEVDERYSTTAALQAHGQDPGADIDAVAAAIILEQFLSDLP